jgi:hypothetical protein
VGGVSAEPPPAGEHPLACLIAAAAAGRFPEPDGGGERVPPWRPGLEAIPGNAASVRALLSAGFVPLGSVQLFHRAG